MKMGCMITWCEYQLSNTEGHRNIICGKHAYEETVLSALAFKLDGPWRHKVQLIMH